MIKQLLIFGLFSGMAFGSTPNIVFVFTDDHATQAISAYGGILADVAPTPHLDALAAEGMRFDRCMVGNSTALSNFHYPTYFQIGQTYRQNLLKMVLVS